ncbi:HutD family protein [Streptomyces sp. NPDC056144]|uniref:HutD/Ves family protein n=1 Tax=unclassified Streptomyces TaxID=2593676 RepID=UPI0035D62DC5
MRHPYDVETLTAGRWRNGGGATREIVSWPAGAEEFQWRASVADIDGDGPFSAFPGIDRTFTLLSGDGVRLVAPGAYDRTARVGEPLEFSGDLELAAELRGGPCRAFNIMVRRGPGDRAGRVERTTGPVTSASGRAGVFYVLHGQWRTGAGESPLDVGQGVWWDGYGDGDGGGDGDGREPGWVAVPVTAGAVALWAEFSTGSGGRDRGVGGGR